MIKKIEINNFKSIKFIDRELKNFCLFCGENASGKTSFLHSILANIQSHNNDKNFNGNIINIGTLSELKNYENGDKIEIILYDGNNKKKKTIFQRNNVLTESENEKVLVKEDVDFGIKYENNLFYLSSNRNGICDIYSEEKNIFGIDGSNIINFAVNHKDDEIIDEYQKKFNKEFCDVKITNKFFDHVRFWFKKITNETINIEPIPFTNTSVLTYNTEKNIRAINTGSGLTYVLQIIIMCLGSILINKNPTLIIENPEIYLHPEAQFLLVNFFRFMTSNIQFIIETHSEYILKASMDSLDLNTEIFVFKCTDKETKISSLNETGFLTSPIAYSEVLYKAFNIPTEELHIMLYSNLQERYITSSGKNSIKDFDEYLSATFPNIPKKHRLYNGINYNNLPTFIRNCIDHPEQVNAETGHHYEYNKQELKKSIDFMLSIFSS